MLMSLTIDGCVIRYDGNILKIGGRSQVSDGETSTQRINRRNEFYIVNIILINTTYKCEVRSYMVFAINKPQVNLGSTTTHVYTREFSSLKSHKSNSSQPVYNSHT